MTVVVKLGGARAVDPGGTIVDIAHLSANGEQVVLVHGGSSAIDDTIEAFGRDPEYITTPDGVVGRFTDQKDMEAVTMALARVNADLVVALANAGIPALGLRGIDGGLLQGPRTGTVRVMKGERKLLRRGDHAGSVASVNVEPLELALHAGYVPVVTLPMLADDGGESIAVNADADRAGAAIAADLEGTLVYLTDVAGILRDLDEPDSIIDLVDDPVSLAAAETAAGDFMGRKLMAAMEALEGGAERIEIADANARDPILSALRGGGTSIHPGALGGGAEEVDAA